MPTDTVEIITKEAFQTTLRNISKIEYVLSKQQWLLPLTHAHLAA
jgi:hypothetical protein